MAQQYPEVKAEIEEIESVLQLFAHAHAVSPPDILRDSVLNNIENDATQPPLEQKPLPNQAHKQAQNTEKIKDSEPEKLVQIIDNQSVVEKFDIEEMPTNRFGFLGRLFHGLLQRGLQVVFFIFIKKSESRSRTKKVSEKSGRNDQHPEAHHCDAAKNGRYHESENAPN